MSRAKKRVSIGRITGGPLQGLPAELVRKGASFTVRLLEGRGAYSAGDVVNISAGEFSSKELVPNDEEETA
jgi:hypothetical protein